MNFVKRAALSLLVRRGRSALLLAVFTVICTLVFSGLVLKNAASASAAAAERKVGSVVTLQWDEEKALKDGGAGALGSLPANAVLGTGKADALGKSPLVNGYNYLLDDGTVPKNVTAVHKGQVPANIPSYMDAGMFPLEGVRDSSQLDPFSSGKDRIVAGRGITAADSGRDVVLVDQRLAQLNKLKVGDTMTLTSADGKNPRPFQIVGIYTDPTTSSSKGWLPPQAEPGNLLYAPVAALGRLSADERNGSGMTINSATYHLYDPGTLDEFRRQATAAGLDMNVFELTANSTLYQQLAGPINNVASFATLAVWLIGIAGAALLSLLIALGMRERRTEMGVLLSMGERKWRLLGQHLAEAVALGALAVGLSVAIGHAVSQQIGDTLLNREVAAAPKAQQQAGAGGGAGQTSASPAGTGASVSPVSTIHVAIRAADITAIAGIGVGIGLLATALPGLGILRLNPRTILMKGE